MAQTMWNECIMTVIIMVAAEGWQYIEAIIRLWMGSFLIPNIDRTKIP